QAEDGIRDKLVTGVQTCALPIWLVGDAHPWAWRFWEASLRLRPGRQEIVVRAEDSGGAGQPADPAAVWNFKGYVNNAWYRVTVEIGRASCRERVWGPEGVVCAGG